MNYNIIMILNILQVPSIILFTQWIIFSADLRFFLRLGETHNALQLPVPFFFSFFSWLCQRYPEYQEIWSKKLFYSPPNS